ncbi:hypothetical protein AC1031_018484 [Aphanomyces cochlioides]|nr:hypothetical protein AC1031_018484 [Aphanomyces cochlioides]
MMKGAKFPLSMLVKWHFQFRDSMNTLAKIVLIAVNLGFLAAGALLIALGAKAYNAHWTDVFSTDRATDVNSMAAVIIALGAVIIVIAAFGFAGAIFRSRCLLTSYTIFVVIGLAIFITVTVLGFTTSHRANDWGGKEFPADAAENNVTTAFNEVYCYAEGGRFCLTSSVKDSMSVFFPTFGDAGVASLALLGIDVNATTGLLGVCDQVKAKVGLSLALPDGFQSACETCQDVKNKYGDYTSIFDWTNDKCPLTQGTGQWCGKFLVTKNQTTLFLNAPYEQCHVPVLKLWKDYGKKVAIGGIIMAVASLVLVVLACRVARKGDNSRYEGVHS